MGKTINNSFKICRLFDQQFYCSAKSRQGQKMQTADVHHGVDHSKKVGSSLNTQRWDTGYVLTLLPGARGWVIKPGARAPSAQPALSAAPPPAAHSYTSMQPEMDRVMEFYEKVRVDGLIKREETPRTMTEYYQGRPDLLSYRHVNFGPRTKKLALNSAESNPRPVVVSTRWDWGQGAHSLWWAKITPGGEQP